MRSSRRFLIVIHCQKKDYYKQFDETVKKELPKSYTYDAKTGRVTTTAFTGDINRWEQTITVDKAGDSDAFKKR